MKEDVQQLDQYYDAIVDELETLDDFSLDDTIANYMYMVAVGQNVSQMLSLSAAELFSIALKIWYDRHPFTLPPCFENTTSKKSSVGGGMFGSSYIYKWPTA